jgi:hypothetical protein
MGGKKKKNFQIGSTIFFVAIFSLILSAFHLIPLDKIYIFISIAGIFFFLQINATFILVLKFPSEGKKKNLEGQKNIF